jgi:hypothetical protein
MMIMMMWWWNRRTAGEIFVREWVAVVLGFLSPLNTT